ncbi:SMI1/KNR4 family protein [Dethiothermospora halolimnae]|uniref:SMI1/KNR4 family protein n=1 Tax=Dethiothermospora halolimnae TaxID=3114390 RepID=UPI003CCC2BAF
MDNKIKWKFVKDMPSLMDIEKVESRFNVKLPLDYIECVKKNNGGRPRPKLFDFGEYKEMVFSSLLSIIKDHKENVIDVYKWIGDRLPENTYPFAKDPFGNYLCFKYEGNDVFVVFWNHEKSNEEEGIVFVSGSFKELLEKLH